MPSIAIFVLHQNTIPLGKKTGAEKNHHKKALIPLPPTGFASFFCANPDVVQTNLQPRRAMGLCGGWVITQNAKF
jgi:hypothetical protein